MKELALQGPAGVHRPGPLTPTTGQATQRLLARHTEGPYGEVEESQPAGQGQELPVLLAGLAERQQVTGAV